MSLKDIPARSEIIFKPDPRIETYRRDAVISGDPDAVVRPRDWQEVAEMTAWCKGNGVPLTVCGARTSMTGSSVAENGVLMTTDHFSRVIDIGTKDGKGYAIVEPAIVARDFQRIVEEKGLYYPVVPTSCDNAFVGGTVATNATGEDFYKYGPTRSWVREISFIKADGTTATLKRTKTPPKACKGHGGYFMDGEEIDVLIGSEGTLGIISRIVFELKPQIPKTFIILAPFRSHLDALKFIDDVNRNGYSPRALEYIDTYAIKLMRTHAACPNFPNDIRAFVYIKDETFEGDLDVVLGKWADILGERYKETPELFESAIIATTDKQKEDLHALRHQIPQAISEINEKLEKDGGGKVSGDWWVPKDKMLTAMQKVYSDVLPLELDFTMYGHLGDGHPHTTFLCKNAQDKALAKGMVKNHSAFAASLGGGVAGEHGIGKIKHDLLNIQFTPDVIARMRAIKDRFDPKWILGQGNIF